MTAEIAILNKTAVALATDSAVTISNGTDEEKIFLTSDKLFELSRQNPIGIMIYNTMQFMQVPLDMVICEYRRECQSFDNVEKAAENFLEYLNESGKYAPDRVIADALSSVISPVMRSISSDIIKEIQGRVGQGNFESLTEDMPSMIEQVVGRYESAYDRLEVAEFVGGKPPNMTKTRIQTIREIVIRLAPVPETFIERAVLIGQNAVLKNSLSGSRTGIVIAGFGEQDKFPTLVSYEIDSILFGRLKFSKTEVVDIDRESERARVLPFAQKEMVERFLYGIDAQIEDDVTDFVKRTVPDIKNGLLSRLEMPPADKTTLESEAASAENVFINNLSNKAFAGIRNRSRAAIEEMVEFMPKPELVNMAEALVNLTSIKRKVSRGMETVGGPIDVAIISRNEGFVWVKRKHYFSSELNPRYSARVHNEGQHLRESKDGQN